MIVRLNTYRIFIKQVMKKAQDNVAFNVFIPLPDIYMFTNFLVQLPRVRSSAVEDVALGGDVGGHHLGR